MEVHSKDIFVVVDWVSSHVIARLTPDKSFASAKAALEEYLHLYSLPYSVQSDNGPSFRNSWMNWLQSLHISCHYTSPYRSASNGLVERNLGKIKSTLLKLGKVNKEILGRVCYELNCLEHADGSLSPNEKFLSRGVRSYLPNSMRKEIDRRALIQRRMEVQEKIARKKGNQSRDSFEVGDKVRIRSNHDGRWGQKGVIIEARSSGSSSPPASFLILTETGAELLRHKSYIKHDATGLDLDLGNEETQSADDSAPKPASPDPVPVPLPWEGRLRARRERE